MARLVSVGLVVVFALAAAERSDGCYRLTRTSVEQGSSTRGGADGREPRRTPRSDARGISAEGHRGPRALRKIGPNARGQAARPSPADDEPWFQEHGLAAAGAHTFQMAAERDDRTHSARRTRAQVAGAPPYWQTRTLFILIGINLASISWLFYYRNSRNLKLKQEALMAFSRRLLESQEAERKRIASELHDSLGQDLMVIKNEAVIALRTGPGAAREHLMQISAAASQAIDEVRRIAYALRPYQLDHLGLTTAVASMVKRVGDSSGIRFTSSIDEVDGLFARESEVSLYRIVQEGVSNIVRHSGATEATVRMSRSAEWLTITIADNGRGFGFDPQNTGLGLVGITERVHLLRGTSEIVSAPGAGTSITIRIRCLEECNARAGDSIDRGRSSDLSQRAVAGGRG